MRDTPNLNVEWARIRNGQLATSRADGNNGAFLFKDGARPLRVIVSDGGGWEHVSVSVYDSDDTPSWEEMCRIKGLFFTDDECVMQLHPPKSDYVNVHVGCLHLWRPLEAEIPRPPQVMV